MVIVSTLSQLTSYDAWNENIRYIGGIECIQGYAAQQL